MNEMNEKKNKGLFNKRSDSFGKGLGFELGNCFWKKAYLSSLGSRISSGKKLAAILKPENKPTKVNWTLSWPSALGICGKTVLE